LAPCAAAARELRIGVFGLFHPKRLVISSLPAQTVILTAGTHQIVLSDCGRAFLDLEGNQVRVRINDENLVASEAHVADRMGRASDFLLSVPGKVTRCFRGRLAVECQIDELVAVVEMDLETAVASAVAAESVPGAPLEALKAQAVATRSYYLASRSRHGQIDFCDTTHCQFLREAPSPHSLAAQATAATRGLVLFYEGMPVPALFTGSCGGRTRTLAEIGLAPALYPYFSVPCSYCLRYAPHWSAQLEAEEAAELTSHSEASRLRLGRILGWDVVPGNNYELQREDDVVVVEGRGKGHGVGLCQLGAAWMAEQGYGFREILAHYYPNTAAGTSSH
jgi:peptidoglycan hydrolase-like amidase